jgi:uncharacterized protein YndB with AHSA1/START domain
MKLATRTLVVDVPPERVWEALVSADLIPRWQPVAVGVEQISGRLDEIGASYVVETAIPGRRIKARWQVTRVERERVHEVSGPDPFGHDMVARHLLEPGEAGTVVTAELEYELPGGLVGKFMSRGLKDGHNQGLANLKAMVESAPRSATS